MYSEVSHRLLKFIIWHWPPEASMDMDIEQCHVNGFFNFSKDTKNNEDETTIEKRKYDSRFLHSFFVCVFIHCVKIKLLNHFSLCQRRLICRLSKTLIFVRRTDKNISCIVYLVQRAKYISLPSLIFYAPYVVIWWHLYIMFCQVTLGKLFRKWCGRSSKGGK